MNCHGSSFPGVPIFGDGRAAVENRTDPGWVSFKGTGAPSMPRGREGVPTGEVGFRDM